MAIELRRQFYFQVYAILLAHKSIFWLFKKFLFERFVVFIFCKLIIIIYSINFCTQNHKLELRTTIFTLWAHLGVRYPTGYKWKRTSNDVNEVTHTNVTLHFGCSLYMEAQVTYFIPRLVAIFAGRHTHNTEQPSVFIKSCKYWSEFICIFLQTKTEHFCWAGVGIL